MQHTVIILSVVVVYGCKTWSSTLVEGYRVTVFDNKVLMRIYWPKINKKLGFLRTA
jgi:hypothetical protein